MNQLNQIEKQMEIFATLGGRFCTPAPELVDRAGNIHGFIFDWDGVFHSGQKGQSQSGVFSEADSMGINMMRYGYWRKYRRLLFLAIISGEKDKTAVQFGQREHFNAIYTGIRDKKTALEHACQTAKTEPLQMACVFDDINDISMARHCGIRFQVSRTASPLFMEYTTQQKLCDYLTYHPSGGNAVRECCELMLGLWGNYIETIDSRVGFDAAYQEYWKARNDNNTIYYTREKEQIVAFDPGGYL